MSTHDVKKFTRDAKPKVDSSDPTPWARHPREDIEALTEVEGFLINPRFRRLVQSHSFQSNKELRRRFCWTDEQLEKQRQRERPTHEDQQASPPPFSEPRASQEKREKSDDEMAAGQWTVEDMEGERDRAKQETVTERAGEIPPSQSPNAKQTSSRNNSEVDH